MVKEYQWKIHLSEVRSVVALRYIWYCGVYMVKKDYPTQKTLDKYGLSRLDQKMILEAQGNICPICEKAPSTGRWVIDHQHVKGWKTMPPEKRKTYVRGITCWFCNRNYLAKAITPLKAENIKRYLTDYAIRQKSII